MGRKNGAVRSSYRDRWPWFAAAAVILGAGGAIAAKLPHLPLWAVLLVAGLGAAVPLLIKELRDWSGRLAERRRVVRASARGTLDGRSLPTVGSLGLQQLRVHTAVVEVPYVVRDKEAEVRQCVKAGRPVLIVGHSMAGKTRLAAQVARELLGDWRVLVVDDRTALPALESADLVPSKAVVWLDDAERLIGAGGVTAGLVERLVARGNVVVATIRTSEYEGLHPTGHLRPPEWDVLEMFQPVWLDRKLTPTESRRVDRAVTDLTIRERIHRFGLAEYVGAARQVADRLRTGPTTSPLGHALVLGAADWRRAGMLRPVPREVLSLLAEPHLSARERARAASPEAVEEAITWARQINTTVSLLVPVEGGYEVFDYALDLLTDQAVPVPRRTWQLVIGRASDEELIRVGYAAELSRMRAALQADQDPEQRLDRLFAVLAEWFNEQDYCGSYITNAAAELPALLDLAESEEARVAYEETRVAIAEHWQAERELLVELTQSAGAADPEGLADELHVVVAGAIERAKLAAPDRRSVVAATAKAIALALLTQGTSAAGRPPARS